VRDKGGNQGIIKIGKKYLNGVGWDLKQNPSPHILCRGFEKKQHAKKLEKSQTSEDFG